MRNITMILEAWRQGCEGSWERIEAEGLKRPGLTKGVGCEVKLETLSVTSYGGEEKLMRLMDEFDLAPPARKLGRELGLYRVDAGESRDARDLSIGTDNHLTWL